MTGMTRRLLGLLVALVLATAPLLAVPTPASAGCPYTSCPVTHVKVTGPPSVKRATRPALVVRVSLSGNATPVGKVVITVRRVGGGYSWKRTIAYTGGSRKVLPPRVRKVGTYKVTARFTPKPNSIFRPSTGSRSFRVVR